MWLNGAVAWAVCGVNCPAGVVSVWSRLATGHAARRSDETRTRDLRRDPTMSPDPGRLYSARTRTRSGAVRDRAAKLSSRAAASAALNNSAPFDTVTVTSTSARRGGSCRVRHLPWTLTLPDRPRALRNLRADHATSEAIETTSNSSGVGARPVLGSASSSWWPRMFARKPPRLSERTNNAWFEAAAVWEATVSRFDATGDCCSVIGACRSELIVNGGASRHTSS
jgi:hypothetical protein